MKKIILILLFCLFLQQISFSDTKEEVLEVHKFFEKNIRCISYDSISEISSQLTIAYYISKLSEEKDVKKIDHEDLW